MAIEYNQVLDMGIVVLQIKQTWLSNRLPIKEIN